MPSAKGKPIQRVQQAYSFCRDVINGEILDAENPKWPRFSTLLEPAFQKNVAFFDWLFVNAKLRSFMFLNASDKPSYNE